MKIILKDKIHNELYSIHDITEDMDISFLKDLILKKWKLKKLGPFDIIVTFEGKKLNNLDQIPQNTSSNNFLLVDYKDQKLKMEEKEEFFIVNIRIREIIIFTKERIVSIITPDGGKGTGIIISKKGHILTAKHCWTSENLNGNPIFHPLSSDQRKVIYKGNEKKCKYIWHSNIHDYMICKIKTEKEEYPFMEIDDSGAYPGEKIYLVGFSEIDSLEPVITHGIISHMDRSFKQPFVYFSTDAESLCGQSGGPIVSINNKCRGIHIGRNPNHLQYTTCYIPCFVFTGELLAVEGLYESIFHI